MGGNRFVGLLSMGLIGLMGCQESEVGLTSQVEEEPQPVPQMVVEPPSINFGALNQGDEAVDFFVIRNVGQAPLELNEVILEAPASFTLLSSYELPLELEVGGQIRYEIAYTPESVNEAGLVTVRGSDAENPEGFVDLLGTWSVPALEIEPLAIDFGELPPDCVEEAAFVLKSVGTGPLVINSIGLVGEGDGFGFVSETGPPETPIVLDPGDQMPVPVFFWPVDETDYLGALVVDSNDPAGRKEGTLAGAGLEGALCDGVMTYELEFEVDYKIADVAFLLDTTCSMSGTAQAMANEFAAIASAVGARIPDVTFGVSTYEDYNDASFGSGADKPFRLEQQQTNDYSRVSAVLGTVTINGGADGPESSHEALYQAATGGGYDQNCNSSFDSSDDVRPFMASPLDAFRGLVPGVFDPTIPGTGTVGGMGFRERVFPIFVLATDNQLRDPEGGYGSPGGCALDASFYDVYSAMAEIGGKFVGINTNLGNGIGRGQMEAIAIVTDSFGDMDGDYVDEPTVVDWTGGDAEFREAVVEAIYGLTASAWFDKVHLEIDDPQGYILDIEPDAYYDIQAGTPITFVLTVQGQIVEVPGAMT
ncbi:MAG: hypothetical protein ACI9K2_003371, partial [Myxococcota bacterium]